MSKVEAIVKNAIKLRGHEDDPVAFERIMRRIGTRTEGRGAVVMIDIITEAIHKYERLKAGHAG